MIGVYDSGFGGLAVLRHLRAALPDRDFLYLGDSGRAPYGGRDTSTLLDFAEQCVERLFEEGCRVVVVACNTVSCVGLRHLQRRYAGANASVRVLGVTIPAAEAAVAASAGHIGVLGTARTVASGTYAIEIAKLGPHRVTQRAAPLLAPIVEEGWEATDIARQAVARYVRDLQDVDTLVLGCTHYPLLLPAFEAAGLRARILDPAPFLASRLGEWLARHPSFDAPGSGALRVLCSGDPATFAEHGRRFLGAELPPVGHVAEEGGRLMHRDRPIVAVGQVLRGLNAGVPPIDSHYDWIVVGSGFGGSVSALRLAEKGYRVLVIEKGRRFGTKDFPKTNWDLKRWMWMPPLGLHGFFQMSFLKHVTVLHGVGVGGGSLTYANTLPMPKLGFFQARSWAGLKVDWGAELEPHYATARKMLGSVTNPRLTPADELLREIAVEMGRPDEFHATDVAVYFGDPGKPVPDPFFEGKGPPRTGCTFCGACMTGCRVGAKNTLDYNYLYLAERLGVQVASETEVVTVRPRSPGAPENGYALETRPSIGTEPPRTYTADRVVLAGGVMGTVPLLLEMRQDPHGLPALSKRVGCSVRTNSEALLGVIAPDTKEDLSRGIAITSILHTDDHSHLEPVRYGAGSDFFRTMVLPHAPGPTVLARLAGAARGLAARPGLWLRALTVRDFARRSQVLLYMRTLESTLTMRLGRSALTGFRTGLVTELDDANQAPTPFMPEATELAQRFADKLGGVTVTLLTETLMGTPSTAHILGGACMGESADAGVIDTRHEVFGYPGLYVVDGAAMSANPGVNPSLTITAMAERAMSLVPKKAG